MTYLRSPRSLACFQIETFRRQVAAPAPPELPRPEPTELWHVAINDVPVGPIRREEVARKIGLGAVDGESLVWREDSTTGVP